MGRGSRQPVLSTILFTHRPQNPLPLPSLEESAPSLETSNQELLHMLSERAGMPLVDLQKSWDDGRCADIMLMDLKMRHSHLDFSLQAEHLKNFSGNPREEELMAKASLKYTLRAWGIYAELSDNPSDDIQLGCLIFPGLALEDLRSEKASKIIYVDGLRKRWTEALSILEKKLKVAKDAYSLSLIK